MKTLEDKISELKDAIGQTVLPKVAALFKIPSKDCATAWSKLKIEISNSRNVGGYDCGENRILMSGNYLGRVDIWSEELAHFLRHQYQPNSSEEVHEFFGGLARLVVGGASSIALSESYVLKAEVEAKLDKTVADINQVAAVLEFANQSGAEKATRLFYKELEDELSTLRKIQSWYNSTDLSGQDLRPADNLINMSPLPQASKWELKKKIRETGGLSEALEATEKIVENAENMGLSMEFKMSTYELASEKSCLQRLLADASVEKTKSHQVGYDWAQKLRDSGAYQNLLPDSPDLISLPDAEVRKKVKEYCLSTDGSPQRKFLARLSGLFT